MVKRLLIVIMCLGLLGCAGVGLQLSDNAEEILTDGVVQTVGFLIVDNNPKFRQPLVDWYLDFKKLKEFGAIQLAWQKGIEELSMAIANKPYLIMQMQNAMRVVKIEATGPQTVLELGKYQRITDNFFVGVMAVPYNL